MILGGDQGAVDQRRRLADIRRGAPGYNQPTAQLYHVARRLPLPLLGDRRAAGQRRGRACRSRGQFAGHLDARLGAAVRRRREPATPRPIRCTRRSCSAAPSTRCNVETGEIEERLARSATCRRRPGTPGRSRWCSRRPIRTRSISATSICSRRSTAASSWTRISEDLTREDPGVPPNLDAATAADAPAAASAAASSTRSRRRRCARRSSGSAPTTA